VSEEYIESKSIFSRNLLRITGFN